MSTTCSSDEIYVRKGFWNKVKLVASKIPFLEDALAMYYCAIDPATPLHAKVIAFTAIAYFISPLDAIPDTLPIVGFTDDAGIIASAVTVLGAYITPEHRRKAKEWLRGY